MFSMSPPPNFHKEQYREFFLKGFLAPFIYQPKTDGGKANKKVISILVLMEY